MHKTYFKKTVKKVKKPKRKRLKSFKSLVDKADKALSDFVRERDGWKCYTCGKMGDKYTIDAGHWVKRTHMSVRFDARNVHAQCKRCNNYRNGEEGIYAVKLLEQYGPETLKELDSGRYKVKKYTRQELEDIRGFYKAALEGLNGGFREYLLGGPVKPLEGH